MLQRLGLICLTLALSSPALADDAQDKAAACITRGGRDPACVGGLSGTVQPFKLDHVSRLRLNGAGAKTDITVSIESGGPGDWLATGLYLAEQATVGDSGGVFVEVIRANPWGAVVPLQYKWLARVVYDPKKPLSEQWIMLAARVMPTIPDIEADHLTNEMYDPSRRRRGETPEAAARRVVIEKYGLPRTWQLTQNLGIRAVEVPRTEIRVTVPLGIDLSRMGNCLSRRVEGFNRCEGA